MLNILIAIIIESTETLFILHMYRLYIYLPFLNKGKKAITSWQAVNIL